MDEELYAVEGNLFFCTVMDRQECLIGLPEDAYVELMALGIGAEEVGLTIDRVNKGSLFKNDPAVRMWGELIVIKIEDQERYQVRISGEEVKRLRERGFKDLDSIRVGFFKLPHTHPSRELRAEDFTIDLKVDSLPLS